MLDTGCSPVWIEVGESTTVTPKSRRYVDRFAGGRQHESGRDDGGRQVDALLLQEPHLCCHPADDQYREVRERHRELQLGGPPGEGEAAGTVPMIGDHGRNVRGE